MRWDGAQHYPGVVVRGSDPVTKLGDTLCRASLYERTTPEYHSLINSHHFQPNYNGQYTSRTISTTFDLPGMLRFLKVYADPSIVLLQGAGKVRGQPLMYSYVARYHA